VKYITLTYPQTASLHIQGYMYDYLYKVFLSSGSVIFPSLTTIDTFSHNRTVSAVCPAFTGYEYPSNLYSVTDKNNLFVTITSFPGSSGLVDVIMYSNAGYTKLSDRGILIRNT
jgi:hypothetical protein